MPSSKFCALIVLLLSVVASAADPELSFRHYTTGDGLSQNTVRAIAQDAQGNIWMGTQNGLNRFDGYGFQHFYANPADSTALADGAVFSLLASRWGRLWIGTASTLSCYIWQEARFRNYEVPGRLKVHCLAEEEEGLYLGTDDGLWHFDPVAEAFTQVPALSGLRIRSVYRAEGSLLVATSDGLVRLEGEDAHWVEPFRGQDVSSIAQNGGTGWWIGTYGKGLFRTDARFGVLRHFSRSNGALPADYIRVLQTDAFGRLWVGTYDGLAVFDDLSGRFDTYTHNARPASLSHNSIWSLYVDGMKGMWVGTWLGGANYWNRQNDRIRTLPLAAPGVYGFVSCVAPAEGSDDIWIGTNEDGLFRYDAASRTFIPWPVPGMSGNVKVILPDGPGYLWVGTHLGGLVQLDLASHRIRRTWSVKPPNSINNGCYSLLEEGDDSLWIGTPDGLLLFDRRTETLSPHPVVQSEPRLAHLLITQLVRDRIGRVWIGTDIGLFMLEDDHQTVHDFTGITGGGEAAVSCIREASDGSIWVATYLGLYHYEGEGFRVYTIADGLPNNYVCGILEDENHRLWLSGGWGISCFYPEDGIFRTIQDSRSNAFSTGACCIGGDGAFYFGGLSGISRFRPMDQGTNPYSPAPYISDVRTPETGDCILARGYSGHITEAEITSSANLFTVAFSVVNPLSENNCFAYRLLGCDETWYETSQREVRYSNLSPGRYEFQLRAANSDGRWCRDEVTLMLRVRPEWWQTPGARLGGLSLILLVVGMVVWFAVGRFKMRMMLRIERMERKQLESSLLQTRDMLMKQWGHRPSEEPSVSADEQFLQKALKVVEDNLDNEQFSSQDFADAMNMSRSNLYLRITSITGESAIQFIRKIRLTRACHLLLERRYTVAEISSKVGFSSPSYFATAFKKFVGCSPAEYGRKS